MRVACKSVSATTVSTRITLLVRWAVCCEPVHERSVESDLMVVTVGIVKEGAEATTHVGGVLLAVGEAFRRHARILCVSARPCLLFACSPCHDCPHPGPGAISTTAAFDEQRGAARGHGASPRGDRRWRVAAQPRDDLADLAEAITEEATEEGPVPLSKDDEEARGEATRP